MNKKKIIKLMSLMVFIIFIALSCFNIKVVYAANFQLDEAEWTKDEYQSGNINNSTQKVMGTIIQVIRIVGTATSVIMLIVIAIKYMSAAPEGRAEFKKSATIYLVGAMLLFASTNILGMLYTFGTENLK